MSTKISLVYDSHVTIGSSDTLKDFYCKEDPKTVLDVLALNYPIAEYNSLSSIMRPAIFLDNPASKGVRLPKIEVHGLSINEFIPQDGMSVTGSIADYVSKIPVMKGFNEEYIDTIIRDMVWKKLVDVKILDYGDYVSRCYTSESSYPTKILRNGKQQATSYIDTRLDTPDLEREKILRDILDYRKAVTRKPFGVNDIAKIARDIVDNVPKEFDPEIGSFQKLK